MATFSFDPLTIQQLAELSQLRQVKKTEMLRELIAREHARLLTIQAATDPAAVSQSGNHPTNQPAATAG